MIPQHINNHLPNISPVLLFLFPMYTESEFKGNQNFSTSIKHRLKHG